MFDRGLSRGPAQVEHHGAKFWWLLRGNLPVKIVSPGTLVFRLPLIERLIIILTFMKPRKPERSLPLWWTATTC